MTEPEGMIKSHLVSNLHFTDEQTDTQTEDVTCPRSHNYCTGNGGDSQPFGILHSAEEWPSPE